MVVLEYFTPLLLKTRSPSSTFRANWPWPFWASFSSFASPYGLVRSAVKSGLCIWVLLTFSFTPVPNTSGCSIFENPKPPLLHFFSSLIPVSSYTVTSSFMALSISRNCSSKFTGFFSWGVTSVITKSDTLVASFARGDISLLSHTTLGDH